MKSMNATKESLTTWQGEPTSRRFALLWFLGSTLGWLGGMIAGAAAGAALGIMAGSAASWVVGGIGGETAGIVAGVWLGLAVGWMVCGIVCGAVVGVLQRLLLGERIEHAQRWVRVSALGGGISGLAIGLIVGFSMLFAAGEFFQGGSPNIIASLGMIIALLICGGMFLNLSALAIASGQWLLLVRQIPRRRSVIWLVAPLVARPAEIALIAAGGAAFWVLFSEGSFFAVPVLMLGLLLGFSLTPLVSAIVISWLLGMPEQAVSQAVE